MMRCWSAALAVVFLAGSLMGGVAEAAAQETVAAVRKPARAAAPRAGHRTIRKLPLRIVRPDPYYTYYGAPAFYYGYYGWCRWETLPLYTLNGVQAGTQPVSVCR
jgi:hypothetical protein